MQASCMAIRDDVAADTMSSSQQREALEGTSVCSVICHAEVSPERLSTIRFYYGVASRRAKAAADGSHGTAAASRDQACKYKDSARRRQDARASWMHTSILLSILIVYRRLWPTCRSEAKYIVSGPARIFESHFYRSL